MSSACASHQSGSTTRLAIGRNATFDLKSRFHKRQLPLIAVEDGEAVTSFSGDDILAAGLSDLQDDQVQIAELDGRLVAITRVTSSAIFVATLNCVVPRPTDVTENVTLQHSHPFRQETTLHTWWEHAVIPEPRVSVEPDAPIRKSQKTDSALPLEALRNLGEQYLDALYISKASLAFFVKGPLSRARAQAISVDDEGKGLQEMTEYLRCLLLTNNQTEKKYKDKLASVMKDVAAGSINTVADATQLNMKQKRARSSKPLRPNRDGLFAQEGEYAVRWLCGRELTEIDVLLTNVESHLKANLAALRFREQLLQLILILETLAIEKRAPTTPVKTSVKGGKKPKDLNLMLDLLIDRLCIWQSLQSGTNAEGNNLDTGKGGPQSHEVGASSNKDQLKDFAKEVIVPFFAARVPSIVENLSVKFGLKQRVIPRKRKNSVEHPLDSVESAIPLERRASANARRLQRTSSGASLASTGGASTLTRSHTDSFLEDLIKDRRSSTPQPRAGSRSDRRPFSRSSSISQPRGFGQREVDFGNMSKSKEQKTQQKARIDEEIRNAISAIRKPNRGLVTKEYFGGIQVDATPKKPKLARSQTQPASTDAPDRDASDIVTATPAASKMSILATPARKRNIATPLKGRYDTVFQSPEASLIASTPARKDRVMGTPER